MKKILKVLLIIVLFERSATFAGKKRSLKSALAFGQMTWNDNYLGGLGAFIFTNK